MIEAKKLYLEYKKDIDENQGILNNALEKIYSDISKIVNRETMKLINEMRQEPLLNNYYDAKEAVQRIYTYDIVPKNDGWYVEFRLKTVDEF